MSILPYRLYKAFVSCFTDRSDRYNLKHRLCRLARYKSPFFYAQSMKASTIRKQIDKATKELQALKTQLPNFERLYKDNQAAEAKIKAAQRDGDATLEALSAARGRVF